MKKMRTLASLTLAASLMLSGLPYNALAAAEFSEQDWEKVNEFTNAEVEIGSEISKISPLLNTSSSKNVSVIIELQSEPSITAKHSEGSESSVRSLQAKVEEEQESFLDEAKDNKVKLKVKRKFEHVFNGMEVTVSADELEELAELPQVKRIYQNTYYELPQIDAVSEKASSTKWDQAPLQQIGVLDMWKEGLTGKGLKVGVIDTGVDYKHPDLKDAYKGGYDSFDNDKDPYEEAPIPVEDDRDGKGYEGSSHGTHVSGTIVGRAKNKTSDVQVKGVAYGADLYVYRVLGREGGSSAQVIDGIEKAVKDGMDVINLSLGAAMEKNSDSPDAIAVNNAVLSGVITVVSGGNSADDERGRHYYTAGSPSGARLPITVAAVDSPTVQYDSSATSSFGANYEFPVMAWQVRKDNFASIIGTKPLPVVYANLGSRSDFEKANVKGKVALVSRGTLGFTEKIENARKAGAVAIVVFNGNDADGDGVADLDIRDREGYVNTILGDQIEAIPTFDMKGLEGRTLAKELLADPEKAKTLTFTFSGNYPSTNDPGDRIASFSSRGPIMGDDYSIKPNLAAPGVAVLSSYPSWSKLIPNAKYDKAYARLNGTSMAAPHVSGLALLLKQAHPDWTPADIKAALANTSKPLYSPDGTLYDVYSQGAGRVNGYAASKTPAVLTTVEQLTILGEDFEPKTIPYYADNVSFGLLKAGSNTVTKTLQLKNLSKKDVSYDAKVIMHPSVTTDPYKPDSKTPDVDDINVEISDDSISAKKGDETTFELSLTVDSDAKDGVYEGEVLLKGEKGNPDLRLPFAVHVGEKREDTNFGFDNLKLSDTTITPDGDGNEDSFTLEAELQATDVNQISVEAWDMDDKYVGTLASVFNNYALIAPGPISFSNLDGTYYDGSQVAKKLDPGKYKLKLVGRSVDQSKPKGEQIVKEYEAWKSFMIKASDKNAVLSKVVEEAEEQFEFEVANTTELEQPVLSLPEESDEVTYQVTKSSDEAFIDDEGILKELPAEGEETVTLYVTITSKEDESVTRTVKVDVTLEAVVE
ncbi:S8 family serine peptidase [Brevibacillus formosus]|uniref:S8 family serine peptidase n=1 Tax=Brevibacillus formosus TaxID=54913 RepID=UPI001CA5CD5D|nr:S8 family serine peptidase [Brevibacillus formosus]MBW5469133.1 S8 family serine peptidase [Brevibacillus formosus]